MQNVDYNPDTGLYRNGIVHQANFYTGVRALLNAAPFPAAIRNQRINVITAVALQNFAAPDVDALTTALVTAIRAEYTNLGLNFAAAQVQALTDGVRHQLVGQLQPDHAVAMDDNEEEGFDQLAQAHGVVLSRAKGVPSRIDYNNLPGAVQNEVTARLTEIRNERALWNVAALGPDLTLQGAFSADVCGRQAGIHYQGNHTNNAGWMPAVAAPADPVSAMATQIYNGAGGKLKRILDGDNPLQVLNYAAFGGTGQAHGRRTEYERLRRDHLRNLTDADVQDAAMAALCQGVSAYVEFSMGHSISRLMYEPVNSRVYVTAHYKWRRGYNPFFQVTNFPAV